MTSEEFNALIAQGYNRIPVMREILADLDTPLSVYLKLAKGPYSYLFESVQGGEKWGRYSIIGLPCHLVLKVKDHEVRLEQDGQIIERLETADPLAWIEAFQARYRVPPLPNLPRFTGGLVGYFGYDTVGYWEARLGVSHKPDPLETPDILLLVSEDIVVFDNLKGALYLIVHAHAEEPAALERAQARLDKLVTAMSRAMERRINPPLAQVDETDFVSGFDREHFERACLAVKQYILEGDVMQVVLSQRLSVPYVAEPLDTYRALRHLNPSPYLFYMHCGDFHIAGSSPEILVRLEEGLITVRPIAGTRPRGATEQEDQHLERDLLSDPKERAEHLMLIDLGRNDVGRVAEVGSVRLTEQMAVERYSHVMHIVSNVEGRLRPGMSALDVLRAVFPAGTLSGAPKIRAMQIINELEPVKRGIYAGAVGYLGWSGNMDTAIVIRTAIIKNGCLYVQVGAGIVADSIPSVEWQETMNKGRAVFRAASMAMAGLTTDEQTTF